ncbi:hypothetical protein RUM44_012335 [Polyplax serrata]|uniref:Uncharacterized protein n=1 Tax=Polyplax serrata TaxID=468196 RepID=A0ABR1BCX4_POLSC
MEKVIQRLDREGYILRKENVAATSTVRESQQVAKTRTKEEKHAIEEHSTPKEQRQKKRRRKSKSSSQKTTPTEKNNRRGRHQAKWKCSQLIVKRQH